MKWKKKEIWKKRRQKKKRKKTIRLMKYNLNLSN